MVLEKLNERLGAKAKDFIKLLIETGATLSGGFVLQSIVKYDASPDLDVYVPVRVMPYFLDELIVKKMFEFDYYNHYDATIYCRSFLRKNGIKRVHTFRGDNLMMDIMSVRIGRTPELVCSNFDLTYCQVWFDGTTVFATHPDHIENKKGYLQGDYIEPFVKGNMFLKERLIKYKARGFTTTYEPSKLKLPSIVSVIDFVKCIRSNRDDEFLYRWFNKIVTKWLTSTNKSDFLVPLGHDRSYTQQDELICSEGITTKYRINNFPMEEFKIPDDEGYDSEDMDIDKLIALANREPNGPKGSKGSKGPKEPKKSKEEQELTYRRSLFQLLEYSLLDTRSVTYPNFDFIMGHAENPEKYEPYVNYLRDNCPREGKDMFGIYGFLYDIHLHPLNGGITDESLEKYLEKFYYLSNKEKLKGVPCYYKSDNHICTQNITLEEIQTIVSDHAYKKFKMKRIPKLGLNTVMQLYEDVLTNEKTEDGFHETMCPFCLLPVSRSSGGIYMTHENPKKLRDSKAPYCKKELVVKSLLDKYKKAALDQSNIEGVRIEFCVECGRPCIDNQHFDITSATPTLIPKIPGVLDTCVGGGRIELIARILAVRDVYKYSLINDPRKERVKAALAADKAPNMKAYIDRATTIFNMEIKGRKFNTKVTFVKKYNDPAYKDVIEEKSLSKSMDGVARAAHYELEDEEDDEEDE